MGGDCPRDRAHEPTLCQVKDGGKGAHRTHLPHCFELSIYHERAMKWSKDSK
jgi:hypothetical protein